MHYEIVVTDPAVEDMVDIIGYIQELTQSNEIANAYMTGMLNTIKSLEEMPNRFQIVDDPELSQLGIRYAHYKNYIIAYSVAEASAKVEVYRILYSGSDIRSRILENDSS